MLLISARENEVTDLARVLAVEAEISLKSAGYVAALIYLDPGCPIDQDFEFKSFQDMRSKVGILPGDLPSQVIYCFTRAIALQDLVRERAAAIIASGDPKSDGALSKSTISLVDQSVRLCVELSVLVPWLEKVSSEPISISLQQALKTISPALDRIHPIAQELAAIKIAELSHKRMNWPK